MRKAKSRSGSCESFQPLATVMVLTGHTPYGCFPSWYPGTYSMLVANPFEYTQCAAVSARSSAVESTTDAVQKWPLPPVV